MKKLNSREIATILAALRTFQENPRYGLPHFEGAAPLSNEEIDTLTEDFNIDPDDEIALVWSIEDVHSIAKDYKRGKLTDDEARDVLQRVLDGHDASMGVNWDTLDNHITDVISERL